MSEQTRQGGRIDPAPPAFQMVGAFSRLADGLVDSLFGEGAGERLRRAYLDQAARDDRLAVVHRAIVVGLLACVLLAALAGVVLAWRVAL